MTLVAKLLAFVMIACANFGASPAAWSGDSTPQSNVTVTLRKDGDHCVVRDTTILCASLAGHLQDTLKLPRDTMVHLQVEPSTSYDAIQKFLKVIEKSGFNYPVAFLTEPKERNGK